MTDDTVERVARALKASRLANEADPTIDIWIVQARAAIAAMREPSEVMLGAGYNAGTAGYSEEAKLVWQAMFEDGEWNITNSVAITREVWQAMIDCALKTAVGEDK